MNFLAHLYLSGNNDQIRIGNFIADWVKGNSYENYPDLIKKGILVHRAIDDFTDNHSIVKQNALLFKTAYGRYHSVVIDVVYDYFLANLWENYSHKELPHFATEMYALLMRNRCFMPLQVNRFIPFLIAGNRLLSYKSIEGIRQSLSIMARNTSLPDMADYAVDIILKNEALITTDFMQFFEQIIDFISHKFSIELQPNIPNLIIKQSLSA